MQSGELMVVGKNHISIPLHRFPSDVKVHFVEVQEEPVPCNPGDADSVEYEIHSSFTVSSGFVLHIKWKVSTLRIIKYHVYY